MADRIDAGLRGDLTTLRADLQTLRAWAKDANLQLATEMGRQLESVTARLHQEIATTLRDPVGTLAERLVVLEQHLADTQADLTNLRRREDARLLEAQRQDRLLVKWTARWALLVVGTSALTAGGITLLLWVAR